MQQLNIKNIKIPVGQYKKIEEYKKKMSEDEIEKMLLKAEEQIKKGKTIKATEVFEELEQLYEF